MRTVRNREMKNYIWYVSLCPRGSCPSDRFDLFISFVRDRDLGVGIHLFEVNGLRFW